MQPDPILQCTCPSSSYGIKHSTACYEAQIRWLRHRWDTRVLRLGDDEDCTHTWVSIPAVPGVWGNQRLCLECERIEAVPADTPERPGEERARDACASELAPTDAVSPITALAAADTALPSSAKVHELKCWPEFFNCVADGTKTFELRRDDRGFRVGDILVLREYKPKSSASQIAVYTGRILRKRISYLMSGPAFGLAPDWVCMSLADEAHE